MNTGDVGDAMSMFHTASMFQTKHMVHLKQATVIGWKKLAGKHRGYHGPSTDKNWHGYQLYSSYANE